MAVRKPSPPPRRGNKVTDKQALKEAQRRFGKSAHIEKVKKPIINEKTGAILVGTHRIGYINQIFIPIFSIQGSGMSWDEAFGKSKVLA